MERLVRPREIGIVKASHRGDPKRGDAEVAGLGNVPRESVMAVFVRDWGGAAWGEDAVRRGKRGVSDKEI